MGYVFNRVVAVFSSFYHYVPLLLTDGACHVLQSQIPEASHETQYSLGKVLIILGDFV